jgi:hypothetical protein
MRQSRLRIAVKMARVLSAVTVSVVGFSTLAISQANALTSTLSCRARVLDSRPYSYSVVTINVSTKPGAAVSGTESAGGRTWSMTPNSRANAAGNARLSQKVSAVAKDEVVRVTVHVALDGVTGRCSTSYTPPSLLPLT